MFITYISQWLYQVMQLPIPIVLSPQHIYSITIFNLFIGSLLLGIFLILIERTFNGLKYSDYRIKEKAPDTIEINNDSTSLSGVDNIGRKRFPGNSSRSFNSMAKRLVVNKHRYVIEDNRNIGVRLVEPKIKERNRTYISLSDYFEKKSKERNEEK